MAAATLVRRPVRALELGPEIQSRLQCFETSLDISHVESAAFGPRVIGHGEITTVLSFDDPLLEPYAFKRMALFHDVRELQHVADLYDRYNGLLDAQGVDVPGWGSVAVQGFHHRPVLYLVQERVPTGSFANQLVRRVPESDARRLFRAILMLEHGLYARHESGQVQVGIDGQLSNFSVRGTGPDTAELPESIGLQYLDTSTAMLRTDGQDLLDIDLFLRVMPAMLRGVVRMFFLRETIDKYFCFRGIVLDLVGNLYKEKCPHLVGPFVEEANRFFAAEAPDCAPLTEAEAARYYRGDAFTWELVARLRRLEYFISRHILRRPYPHILPGPVQR